MNSAFTIFVPRLQTERLLLREFRCEDFDAFAEHFANPVSAAHLIQLTVKRYGAFSVHAPGSGSSMALGGGR